MLLTIDEDGHSLLINVYRRNIAARFNFKSQVHSAEFSPDSKFIAVGFSKIIQIWKVPSVTEKEFAPFTLFKTFSGHHDDIISIDWSLDSKYIVTASTDMMARVYTLETVEGYLAPTISGHRDSLVRAYFSADSQNIYTVSKDGAVFKWKSSASLKDGFCQVKEGKWSLETKNYFHQNSDRVSCVAYHKANNVLTVGFTNGVFGLYELESFNHIHSLSISQKQISTVSINNSGEWLAFGCQSLGQLLVWEWQSETYVLKQQGHFYDMNCVSYSPDGQLMATGGDDGKVKLWQASSGFCFVTFTEHSGVVYDVKFAKNGKIVLSVSADGTVRAFDLIRYRNFKTLTTPTPVQLCSLAVDGSGEVVAAGTIDTFEIYLWSLQTGNLVDVFSGHQGPITSLCFDPIGHTLFSGSWDNTARLWELYSSKKDMQILQHRSDVLSIAYRPDGKQVAVSTLDGEIAFWDPMTQQQTGLIEGRRDISGGRRADQFTTAQNASSGKSFNSLAYTADGSCLIGGGNSKYVCIYEIETKTLLKKFQLTRNLSLDGTLEFLNSKNMTDAGPLDLLQMESEDDYIPGVKQGDKSKRKTRPAIRTKSVCFSPTGRSWSAATTEGLVIYSLDDFVGFDPLDLEIEITPETIQESLSDKNYSKALSMALRLNHAALTSQIIHSVPSHQISLTVRLIPQKYLSFLIKSIASELETSSKIEFLLSWACSLLENTASVLKSNKADYLPVLRFLQKSVQRFNDDLGKLVNQNIYNLEFHKLVNIE